MCFPYALVVEMTVYFKHCYKLAHTPTVIFKKKKKHGGKYPTCEQMRGQQTDFVSLYYYALVPARTKARSNSSAGEKRAVRKHTYVLQM